MDRTILTGLGLTEAELIEIRDAAIAQLRDAAVVTQMSIQSGNGIGRGKGWQVLNGHSPTEVLRAVKYALWKLDKTKYADCKPTARVTYARFVA